MKVTLKVKVRVRHLVVDTFEVVRIRQNVPTFLGKMDIFTKGRKKAGTQDLCFF